MADAKYLSSLLSEYSPELKHQQIKKLVHYLFVMKKWNRVYNLTSITTDKAMVVRHILDSLSISPYLHGEIMLDVGSGAGLPGIPLAILHPDKKFYLLDSNGKKVRFMTQAKLELGLKNIEIVPERIEHHEPQYCYHTIMSRAFANLRDFFMSSEHILGNNGIFLAMKGVYPHAELEEIPRDFFVDNVIPLNVTGLDAERHVVVARRAEHHEQGCGNI